MGHWVAVRSKIGLKSVFALPSSVALAMALSSCAIAPNPHFASFGPGLSSGMEFNLSGPLDNAHQRQFAAALRDALLAKGLRESEAGGLLIDYSVSTRPSDSGIAGAVSESAQNAKPEFLSRPRKKEFLDACAPIRLRTTIVALSRSSGEVTYRGIREIDLCEVTGDELASMAGALVVESSKN